MAAGRGQHAKRLRVVPGPGAEPRLHRELNDNASSCTVKIALRNAPGAKTASRAAAVPGAPKFPATRWAPLHSLWIVFPGQTLSRVLFDSRLYHYFLRLGILDGLHGYILCHLLAEYEFLIWAKRHELELTGNPGASGPG